MKQSTNYWFGQNASHMYLFAQDETGKTFRVRTMPKDNEPQVLTEHRLICSMHKKHNLITAY
jgi:hypothetical protein